MVPKILAGIKRKDFLRSQAFIDDVWVDAVSGKTLDMIDPATLEKLATFPEMGTADRTSKQQHVNGRAEVAYGASFLEWSAGEAEWTHGETIPSANLAQRIVNIKQPIGVATCLVPWNLPIAMIIRKVGAALAAGCTTAWKPAGRHHYRHWHLANLAKEAGFPREVSTSSPLSIAWPRILVQAGIHDKFVSVLIEKVKALKVGPGTGEGADIGALTHERAVEKAMKHIVSAVEQGGKSLRGEAQVIPRVATLSSPPSSKNMARITSTWKEESFAPILGVYKFETEEEGISLANDCDVGLDSFI
ncbi:uncharacterized protein Z519_11563 [Cladophialophora bantiana CBS 173.52]|uniref:Aldehyde dehydrogenase domain-containing protein n=1 Tax=Cladophialophora bantiana (strain ATCC 10958 / CBS 173.52 / CDC B-1940 / NIH 8579) TaxID=1442370 RepID=A0A0D2H3V8_CLAB1|nr:uncharacterized protein Z519_11563 [Cladophialophora bantiana CBS 173.52]KIW87978.1 hypothetical protein Z519_11563 [Cladophialophora bantiana CBS 173.52]